MAYAVIKTGGKQFVVEKGSTIRIPSIEAEAGKSIELDANRAALFHHKLFPAGLNNCVCHLFTLSESPRGYRKVVYYRHLTRKRQPLTLTSREPRLRFVLSALSPRFALTNTP